MMVSGSKIAEWLSKVVQIPSVSPTQAGPRAGEPGEARLAEQLAMWFRELGGEVHMEEVLPARPNVYAIFRGQLERWVAVDTHMDTVSVEQMTDEPFDGRIENGRVYGRGAVDTKATFGVVLALLEAMREAGQTPEPNLLVVATSDEEHDTTGARAFAKWVRQRGITIDQLLVAEPTLCGPIYGHKGVSRIEFTVEGKATHTSQPHLGKNAITAAARMILAFDEENERLRAEPLKMELGTPTLTVSIIHGGTGLNVVPDVCRVSVDRRVVAGEKSSDVAAALCELAERNCPLPVTAKVLIGAEAFLERADSPWIQQLAEWSREAPAVVPYGTNACAYSGLAKETVVLGPGSIDQAHGAAEWVEIVELEKAAGIYSRWWGIAGE
jgi:acetylornithine deacetylase/succinyl-diaminopimelate desuccinylase-like protein